MTMILQQAKPVPFLRHVAAVFYDSMLLVAIWVVVGFVFVAINRGEAIAAQSALYYGFQSALVLAWAWFCVYFWCAQAQTLGMRAWRLVVVNELGHTLNRKEATKRFVFLLVTCLPLGFGFFWRLLDSEGLTLYDRLAKTRLWLVEKNPYKLD